MTDINTSQILFSDEEEYLLTQEQIAMIEENRRKDFFVSGP
jgi:hypothetical protein